MDISIVNPRKTAGSVEPSVPTLESTIPFLDRVYRMTSYVLMNTRRGMSDIQGYWLEVGGQGVELESEVARAVACAEAGRKSVPAALNAVENSDEATYRMIEVHGLSRLTELVDDVEEAS